MSEQNIWPDFCWCSFSILPTLVYPVSLWFLAQPVGHIDVGGIIGSYIGLIFLSGIYVAAGVWASALTENQIIAFLYTLVVAFLLYTGLDFIAGIPLFEDYQTSIQFWGIHFHYEPMSRGVIAFSDVVYFVSFVFLFSVGYRTAVSRNTVRQGLCYNSFCGFESGLYPGFT